MTCRPVHTDRMQPCGWRTPSLTCACRSHAVTPLSLLYFYPRRLLSLLSWSHRTHARSWMQVVEWLFLTLGRFQGRFHSSHLTLHVELRDFFSPCFHSSSLSHVGRKVSCARKALARHRSKKKHRFLSPSTEITPVRKKPVFFSLSSSLST